MQASTLAFFIGIAIVTEALMFYNAGHMVMWLWRRGLAKGRGKGEGEGRLFLWLYWYEHVQLTYSGVS